MFGDNQSVVTSGMIPHSILNKQWTVMSYHQVHEAIATGILKIFYISKKTNPADMLSKHCGYQEFWPHIKLLLFWKRDTMEINQTKPPS